MASTKKFVEALELLETERGIKKEIVLDALKEALEKSYKKNYLTPDSVVRVDINPKTARIRLFELKNVVEEVEDPDLEISLEEAREKSTNYQIGDVYETEVSPDIFGRLAAVQTKQILRQKIREAEKESLFNEFADKKDDIITGIVDRVEERFAIVNIGKTGAFLAKNQQIPNEKLLEGQHIKVYVSEVEQNTKGTHIVVSRTDVGLVRRLFELEVPEIYDGIVEIVSVSREPGERSKIAVTTKHDDVDAIGACVGPKGSRVRNVVNELNGEMMDIVQWSNDPAVFISNALSPANVITVIVNENEKSALAIVPDNQLSLAIGKRGQNARLAVRLTNWKIDIKSLSAALADGSYVQPTVEEHVEEILVDDDFQEEFEKMMIESEEVEEEIIEEEVEEIVEETVVEEIEEVEEEVKEVVEETVVEEVEDEENDEDFEDDEEYDDEWDDDDEYDRYAEEIDYDAYDEYYDD